MKHQHNVEEIISSINLAVASAKSQLEKHQIQQLEEYFDKDGKPKCFIVQLPLPNEEGKLSYKEVQIPIFCLAPHHSLKIKKMKIKMDAGISAMTPEDEDGDDDDEDGEPKPPKKHFMHADLFHGKDKNNSQLTMEMTLEGDDPPEALSRILQSYLKMIPH